MGRGVIGWKERPTRNQGARCFESVVRSNDPSSATGIRDAEASQNLMSKPKTPKPVGCSAWLGD
jgi:hypothetical protein